MPLCIKADASQMQKQDGDGQPATTFETAVASSVVEYLYFHATLDMRFLNLTSLTRATATAYLKCRIRIVKSKYHGITDVLTLHSQAAQKVFKSAQAMHNPSQPVKMKFICAFVHRH